MSKVKDGLFGFVIGDAFGAYCEFQDREALVKNPVTNMYGHGSFDIPEGTWTDDTSMTLATINSIINKKTVDPYDIMANFYYWLKEGRFTTDGKVFDVGRTCLHSISRFTNDLDITKCGATDIDSNGNGSLMRMLPIVLYCYYKNSKLDDIYTMVKEVSSLTHAHEISIMGCYIYVRFLLNILNGKSKGQSYNSIKKLKYDKFFKPETIEVYSRILKGDINKVPLDEIKSTGYVVDTLEAVLYVVLNTEKFPESIIGAANLGGDTDTIAAITGSITGIIYGYDSIPKGWIAKLQKPHYLNNVCETFETVLKNDITPYYYNYWAIVFDASHNNMYRKEILSYDIDIEDKYMNRIDFMDLLTLIESKFDENSQILKSISEYIQEVDELNESIKNV